MSATGPRAAFGVRRTSPEDDMGLLRGPVRRSASQGGHEAGFAPLEAIPKFALVRELPRPLAASIPYDAVGLPPMPGWKSAGSGSQRSSPFSCGTEVKSDVAPKTVKRAESHRML